MQVDQVIAPKKHVFFSKQYSRFKQYVVHPDDLGKDPEEITRYKCLFQNGMYMTDDDREAEALLKSPRHTKDYEYDDKGRFNDVQEQFFGSDKVLVDKLNGMKRTELISLALNPEFKTTTKEIYKMTKEKLVKLLLQKKPITEKVLNGS